MRRKVIAEEGAKRAEDRRQAILDQQEEGRGWERPKVNYMDYRLL